MRETVVSIQRGDKGSLVAFLDSPSKHDGASDVLSLPLVAGKMPPLDTSDNVTNYGLMVRKALSSHPAIGKELDEMFGITEPERLALKFLIGTSIGEGLRWETLHSGPPEERFLAISDMCTISRVTLSNISAALRAFTYPLQMVAFLSAAGVGADKELEKICGQVMEARKGLELRCTIYLGEQELLDSCQKRIAEGDLKDQGITVAPIPTTATEIGILLRDTSMQFLHFFCHGIERAGVQGLSLATINDHDKNHANDNAAASSIFLSVDALGSALALNPNVWITVLNSCSGAAAVRQLYSMALTVAKKGCPYTVGMADPIDIDAATTFSEAFYGELFTIVKNGLSDGAANAPLVLDLSPAVIPARKIIHDHCSNAAPDAFGRWLLPLLYERIQRPLLIQMLPPAMAKRIQEIARQLRIMPLDTPTPVRDQILGILDKAPAVPSNLRPNRYGAFG
jgi:hypothetical protein